MKLFIALAIALLLPVSAFALPVISESIHTDWTFESGLLYGFDGDGQTYDYASYINFSDSDCGLPDWATGTYIGTSPRLPRNLYHNHTLPAGLQVPPDEVTTAKLWIDGWLINSDNNTIKIESPFLQWDPLNDWSFLSFGDNSLYDLTDVSMPDFWNTGALDICIHSNEWKLRIDRSILMMDYTQDPIPEPTTLVLVGMGLLGAGVVRKFRS